MYQDFARIYDNLQPQTEYEKFVNYIEEIFEKFKKTPKLILDLACGTGRLTTLLAKHGYDMIGVDISSEALNIAADRAKAENLNILFSQQDMTDFELYGTVDAIVCCFDSLNYITDLRDLKRCLKLCENYLNPGGLVIFDINTQYKFEKILADNTFVYDFDNIFCVWENNYNKKLNEFHITIFEKNGKKYERFEETHLQRCFSMEEIKKILASVNMPVKSCFNEFSLTAPKKKSERIFFVCEKLI